MTFIDIVLVFACGAAKGGVQMLSDKRYITMLTFVKRIMYE